MSNTDRMALNELLQVCQNHINRDLRLLERWKDRPSIQQQTVDQAQGHLAMWERRRDALAKILSRAKQEGVYTIDVDQLVSFPEPSELR